MSVALNLKFWPDDILTDFIEEILMLLASEIFDSKPRDDMYYYVRVIFFFGLFFVYRPVPTFVKAAHK